MALLRMRLVEDRHVYKAKKKKISKQPYSERIQRAYEEGVINIQTEAPGRSRTLLSI